MNLAKNVSILFNFFKEPALSFIDLFYFLSLYVIYFHSDLYHCLPSTNFGLCFYFSSSFRYDVRLRFFLFLVVRLYCYWIDTYKRKKLDYFLIPYTKINSKWNKDLSVRCETIILPGENIDSTHLDISFSNIF